MGPERPVGVLLLTLVYLSGCATMIRGRTQEVRFQTVPAGARVIVNGEPRGDTPVTLDLARKQAYAIRFEKPGYADHTFFLLSTPSTGVMITEALLLVPILVGYGVDLRSGAFNELVPRNAEASLSPLAPDATSSSASE